MFKVQANSGSPKQYGEADYAEVTDSGHLVLLVGSQGPREVVAVFAPGHWAYAEHVKQAS